MSTYEIDDTLVRRLVDNHDLLPKHMHEAMRELAKQIPIPAPTKIGAVVRTTLKSSEGEQSRVWVGVGDGYWVDPENTAVFRTSEIGRIVEVLSDGVPL